MQTGILAAQQILKFNGIKGEYIVDGNSDINLKAALEKAVNDTKMEALWKAGVKENVSYSNIALLTIDQGAK